MIYWYRNFSASYDASSLRDQLSHGAWKVTFTKVDGSTRVMKCTRDYDSVKQDSSKFVEPQGKRIPPDHQIVVWDLEKDAFRSFRIGSIIDIVKINDKLIDIDYEIRMQSNEFKTRLNHGTWLVKYKMISGVEAEMICTRDFSAVLQNDIVEKSSRIIPDNQIIVWDLDHNGFRSFRFENIISYTKISNSVYVYYNKTLKKTKSQIEDILKTGVYLVEFIKRDGSDRKMVCTLDPTNIPREYDGVRYPHLITVWDLEKDDFRNIVYRSIYNITKLNNSVVKNFSENNSVKDLASSYVNKWSKYFNKIHPMPKFKVEFLKLDDRETPAFCDPNPEDGFNYKLVFDLDKIHNRFDDQYEFIICHELCHICNEEIIKSKNESGVDKVSELEFHGGHGDIFIKLMNDTPFIRNNDKLFRMQFQRHIAKYI